MRRISRQWVPSLVALTAAAALAAGYLLAGDAGLVIAFSILVAGLAALVTAIWRAVRGHERRLRSQLNELDGQARDQFSALDNRVTALDHQLATMAAETRQLASVLDRLEKSAQHTLEAIETSRQMTSTTLDSGVVQLRRELDKQRRRAERQTNSALVWQFRQLEALGALYYGIRPGRPIPSTRSWAASPDLLRYLFEAARAPGVRHVLECGSGVSTLVLAYGLRAQGSGRVVALEHLAEYAELTRTALRDHQLEDWAEVRLAPLTPVELAEESWPWYHLDAVPAGPFDLILVDGPPGETRAHARFPALPLLYDRLAPGGRVILDDYAREDERRLAEMWSEQFPSLVRETPRHEKGTIVFRRPA